MNEELLIVSALTKMKKDYDDMLQSKRYAEESLKQYKQEVKCCQIKIESINKDLAAQEELIKNNVRVFVSNGPAV